LNKESEEKTCRSNFLFQRKKKEEEKKAFWESRVLCVYLSREKKKKLRPDAGVQREAISL